MLSLLQTCRKIREEAKQIFYSINKISIEEKDLVFFDIWSSSDRQNLVRNLTVHSRPIYDIDYLLSLVQDIKHLRSVRLHFRDYAWHYAMLLKRFTSHRDSIQKGINALPNLLKIDITTDVPETSGESFEEIRKEIQSMIERRTAPLLATGEMPQETLMHRSAKSVSDKEIHPG